MFKKLLTLTSLFTLILAADVRAQVDTISWNYDFENLVNGNLNTQDGWSTTPYNVTDDWKVVDTVSSHSSKLILFNRSGPSVGADASRLLDTISPGFVFDNSNSIYILEFDVKRNYWGLSIGFAADLNNDGKTFQSNTNEKAFIFTTGSLNGELMYLPNSSTLSLGNNLGNNWQTIQIVIQPFNSFAGTFTVGKKALGGQSFTNMVFNSNLYVDTAGAAKYNFTLWNVLFMHAEGANSYFDNIKLTKITNTTTSLNEKSAENISAYYHDYQLFLNTKTSSNEPFEIKIVDAAGRETMKMTQENAGVASLSGLNRGWYCATIKQGNAIKQLPFYAQ